MQSILRDGLNAGLQHTKGPGGPLPISLVPASLCSSASFFADLLLIFCLLSASIDAQGIQGSLHLHYPHHGGHVIFGPCIFIYLFPLSTTWVGKFLAVFYEIILSLLNPIIYTFRNKEIRNAIKRV